jgi:hypothetical protein
MASEAEKYEGRLDFAGAAFVGGWARSIDRIGEPLEVDIMVDGAPFATVTANHFRQDLFDTGKGNGACAFVFPIPRARLRDGKTHSIDVKFSGTDISLANAPQDVFCPYDMSEPLPRQIMDNVARVTLGKRVLPRGTGTGYVPPPMKVHIVCYEDLEGWILGKVSRKLCQNLQAIGIEATLGKEPDPKADINHHIIYWGYVDRKMTVETVMITHIDNYRELGKVRQQLADLNIEMGICMSFETVHRLAQFGVPRNKLSYVSPAHDGIIRPRKIVVGITTRVYPDGCKREHLLEELASLIPPEHFKFSIMGTAWQKVVRTLRNAGFEVEYSVNFDYEAYCKLIPSIDYYLYLGLDEGSMGFLDAVAASVPTIVTPQGYHLDVPGGITHPFIDLDDLVRIFTEIATQRTERANAVASWTWAENARKHAIIWEYLLRKKNGETISASFNDELAALGVVTALR